MLPLLFYNYFISEINLAKDDRVVAEGKSKTDLRFFKDILEKSTHDKIVRMIKKYFSKKLLFSVNNSNLANYNFF